MMATMITVIIIIKILIIIIILLLIIVINLYALHRPERSVENGNLFTNTGTNCHHQLNMRKWPELREKHSGYR